MKNEKISNFLKKFEKDDISEDFKNIFNKSELTINQLTNVFEYYLMIIFPTLNEEIKLYQIDIKDEKKQLINKYLENNNLLINKDIFALSTRLFISLFLFNKDNKEKEIKENNNNIITYYSKISDIWSSEFLNTRSIYINQNDKFKIELEELRKLNIQINQIIKIEEMFGKQLEEQYFNDLKNELNKIEANKLKVFIPEKEMINQKDNNEGINEESEEEKEEEPEEREKAPKRRRKNNDDDSDDSRD